MYDHNEQACTESKDQIKLKLFSCAKRQQQEQQQQQHMHRTYAQTDREKEKNIPYKLHSKLVFVRPIFIQLSRAK